MIKVQKDLSFRMINVAHACLTEAINTLIPKIEQPKVIQQIQDQMLSYEAVVPIYDNDLKEIHFIQDREIHSIHHDPFYLLDHFKLVNSHMKFEEWVYEVEELAYEIFDIDTADTIYSGISMGFIENQYTVVMSNVLYTGYCTYMLMCTLIEIYYKYISTHKKNNTNTLYNRIGEGMMYNLWWDSICKSSKIILEDPKTQLQSRVCLKPMITITPERLINIHDCKIYRVPLTEHK